MMVRLMTILCVAVLTATGLSAAESPREAVKALKITKGKPVRTGVVFVDGKYLAPPYVVARRGTTIRINDIDVTGEIVPWSEFLKTQAGAAAAPKAAAPAAPAAPAAAPAAQPPADPLADLFDDDGAKPAPKAAETAPAAAPAEKPAAAAFEMNARAKALKDRINDTRASIDAQLRRGDYICFGSRYSRVTGDAGAARRLLEVLADIMLRASDAETFVSLAQKGGLSYLPEPLLEDLYRNRVDYPRIRARARSMRDDAQLDALLNR